MYSGSVSLGTSYGPIMTIIKKTKRVGAGVINHGLAIHGVLYASARFEKSESNPSSSSSYHSSYQVFVRGVLYASAHFEKSESNNPFNIRARCMCLTLVILISFALNWFTGSCTSIQLLSQLPTTPSLH